MSDLLDPSKIQDDLITILEEQNGGVKVNSSTPISSLTEATASVFANASLHISNLHSRRFANNAKTKEDLYPHISDKYLNMAFALPSTVNITFFFLLNDLKNSAVAVSGTSYRKLYFPKNTVVSVEGIEFLIPVAINFIVLNNGSIRLEYDLREETDLTTITQNAIPWETAMLGDQEIFQFTVPMLQLKFRKFNEVASPNRAFKQKVEIIDQYHHCVVYSWVGGVRKKLITSLTQEVKDINKPTAIITVKENEVEIEIPLIYFSKGLVGNDIEIDLFVTKGELVLDMSNFKGDAFGREFGKEFFTDSDGQYFNPLARLAGVGIYSKDVTSGGSNAPSFEELKNYALYGTDKTQLPINQNQLTNSFNRAGYSISTELDRLLERSFIASKDLPTDSNNEFVAGISCGITTINISARKLVDIINTVMDNDKRVTLLPGTLIDVQNKPEVVPKQSLPQALASDNIGISNVINKGNYVFNPFHYVIDMSEDRLDLRPYHLEPKIKTRQAVEINSVSQYSVSTLSHEFKMDNSGFILYLNAKCSENITASKLFAQLAFKPVKDTSTVWITGSLQNYEDGIARFKFEFKSSFDIDRHNALYLDDVKVVSGDSAIVRTDLLSKFDLVYGLEDADRYLTSNIDNFVNFNLLSGLPTSLTHESLTVEFGSYLDTLWSKSRNILSSLEYDYYEEDVPYVYSETELLRVDGKLVFEETEDGQRPVVKYHKGEAKVDENGDVIYRYRKGTVKRDPDTNNPLFKEPGRTTDRSLQLFTMDANYLYSNAPSDVAYRKFIIQSVLGICLKDMKTIAPELGENTSIYFYPTNTVGTIDVIDNDSQEISIDSNVSFEVILYMTDAAFKNESFRNSLSSNIKQIISESLSESTVAVALIEKKIKEFYSNEILSVRLESDFTKLGIDIFTTSDKSSKLTIRRKLNVLEDNSLYVNDDVVITPRVHQK